MTLLISIKIILITITILYTLFKEDQNETDLNKKETERWNARLEVIEQKVEDFFKKQNKEPSEEFNLEPTVTSKS